MSVQMVQKFRPSGSSVNITGPVIGGSDVNKDWTCKHKDKDQAYKDQDKDKDYTCKDKDNDLNLVLKESLRTRTRINITAILCRPYHL